MPVRRPTSIKLVCIGTAGVGKTCLLIRKTQKKFPNDYVPTIFDSFQETHHLDNQTIYMELYDTATGSEFWSRLRILHYRDTDVFLLHFPCNDLLALKTCETTLYSEVQQFCPSCPVILVATKSDLGITPEVQQEMLEVSKRLEFCAGCFVTSALNGDGVQECFEAAALIAVGRSKSVVKHLSKNYNSSVTLDWLVNMDYAHHEYCGLEFVKDSDTPMSLGNWKSIDIAAGRKTKTLELTHTTICSKRTRFMMNRFGGKDVLVIPFNLNQYEDVGWVDSLIRIHRLKKQNQDTPIILCGFQSSQWEGEPMRPDIERCYRESLHNVLLSLSSEMESVFDVIFSFAFRGNYCIHEDTIERWKQSCNILAFVPNEYQIVDNIQGFQDALSTFIPKRKLSKLWWPDSTFKDDKRHIKYVVCNIL